MIPMQTIKAIVSPYTVTTILFIFSFLAEKKVGRKFSFSFTATAASFLIQLSSMHAPALVLVPEKMPGSPFTLYILHMMIPPSFFFLPSLNLASWKKHCVDIALLYSTAALIHVKNSGT